MASLLCHQGSVVSSTCRFLAEAALTVGKVPGTSFMTAQGGFELPQAEESTMAGTTLQPDQGRSRVEATG